MEPGTITTFIVIGLLLLISGSVTIDSLNKNDMDKIKQYNIYDIVIGIVMLLIGIFMMVRRIKNDTK
jgi:uncharacterized membrane protein